MNLRNDFVGLLSARSAKLVVGLATIFVYARMFGVSATYDSWVWSLGIINAAGMILFGPLSETIRASYTAIDHHEGNAAAEQYLATVSVIMIGASAIVAAISVVTLSNASTLFADFVGPGDGMSIFFLYVLAPSLVISQVVAILTAHLNCRGKFYSPEIAGIVGGAIGVLFIVAFPQLPAIWLLPVSYYIGLAAPLLVSSSFWPELSRAILRLRMPAFRRYGREALIFSLPLLLPYALGQVSGVIERQFAVSAGTGVLAVLSYAQFARSTVQAVFTATLSALAVPPLARAWNANDLGPFRDTLRHWAHQSFLLMTPGMMVLFGLSDLAPVILFGTNIESGPQHLLSLLLRCYAVVNFGVVMYLLGGVALLAAKKGKTYAALGAILSVFSTLLLVGLFPIIGIVAIPVALICTLPIIAWMMFRAIDAADAGWLIRQTAVRTFVIVAGGWLINLVDVMAQRAVLPISGRVLLGLGAAGLLCTVSWLVDRRQSYPHSPDVADSKS